jgi:hypothetical protein
MVPRLLTQPRVAIDTIAHRFGKDKEVYNDMTDSFIRNGLTQAEIADESLLQLYATHLPFYFASLT